MNVAQSRRRAATSAAETLEAELDRIATLGLDELRPLWLKMTGQGAPKVLSCALLARMIAHRLQEQRLGKLSREMRQRLDGLARGGGEPIRHLKVGTVMVREHQGVTHEVIVVPGGFSWKDKTYPSLSAIAKGITGTSWNGPPFLRPEGKERGGAASRRGFHREGHASPFDPQRGSVDGIVGAGLSFRPRRCLGRSGKSGNP
jgi:hypothetical protein